VILPGAVGVTLTVMENTILRLPQVMSMTGMSRSAVYLAVNRGRWGIAILMDLVGGFRNGPYRADRCPPLG
jgi:Prophage CP4-57 regulatory protein (AlpA)